MMRSMKAMVVGMLALASVAVAGTEVRAMPVQPLQVTAPTANGIEHIWWRGGYGWRGYGFGPRFYGYGWRRPFVGYYGWRRPFYGYGYRRW